MSAISAREDIRAFNPLQRLRYRGNRILSASAPPFYFLPQLAFERFKECRGEAVGRARGLHLLFRFEHQARRFHAADRLDFFEVGLEIPEAVESLELIIDRAVERNLNYIGRGTGLARYA